MNRYTIISVDENGSYYSDELECTFDAFQFIKPNTKFYPTNDDLFGEIRTVKVIELQEGD